VVNRVEEMLRNDHPADWAELERLWQNNHALEAAMLLRAQPINLAEAPRHPAGDEGVERVALGLARNDAGPPAVIPPEAGPADPRAARADPARAPGPGREAGGPPQPPARPDAEPPARRGDADAVD
jgi:hypothetical protein